MNALRLLGPQIATSTMITISILSHLKKMGTIIKPEKLNPWDIRLTRPLIDANFYPLKILAGGVE